jgi:hypothetical protein
VKFIKRSHDLVVATHGRGLFVLDNIRALEELTPQVVAQDLHVFTTQPAQLRVRSRRVGEAPTRFTTPNPPNGAVIDYYLKTALDTGGAAASGAGAAAPGREGSKRGKVIVAVTTPQGDTVVVDTGGPGRQGVNRYVWNLRYAGPTKLSFEKPSPDEEENPFRQSGGPRATPGTYRVAVTAGTRTETASVTVEPDPFVHAEPGAFQAQLQAGLEWRNAVSATYEVLNRIASLETQLKGVQQALRENLKSDTTTMVPVTRQGAELGRKLKELKDSLYNSDVQRDAGQDDIHYLTRFSDRLRGLGFAMALAYAQPPTDVVTARFHQLRRELDGYLARFNELLRTDVATFNKTALERQAPILVAGEPVAVKDVKIVSR